MLLNNSAVAKTFKSGKFPLTFENKLWNVKDVFITLLFLKTKQ